MQDMFSDIFAIEVREYLPSLSFIQKYHLFSPNIPIFNLSFFKLTVCFCLLVNTYSHEKHVSGCQVEKKLFSEQKLQSKLL